MNVKTVGTGSAGSGRRAGQLRRRHRCAILCDRRRREDFLYWIKRGVARAAETVHGLDWLEVTEIRGHIEDGKFAHYQVGLKIGFRLDA